MSWCVIRARNDEIISPPLFRVPDKAILCSWCQIPLLPRGTYATAGDLVRLEWLGGTDDVDRVYVNFADLTGVHDTGKWHGCCSSDGDLPNLEAADGTPLAHGFSDCWNSNYVWIPSDWHEREPLPLRKMPGDPVIRVALVDFGGRDRVVERAGGPDEEIATMRLMEAARAEVKQWIHSADSVEKLMSRIRICTFEEASNVLNQTGCVNWLTTKGI